MRSALSDCTGTGDRTQAGESGRPWTPGASPVLEGLRRLEGVRTVDVGRCVAGSHPAAASADLTDPFIGFGWCVVAAVEGIGCPSCIVGVVDAGVALDHIREDAEGVVFVALFDVYFRVGVELEKSMEWTSLDGAFWEE